MLNQEPLLSILIPVFNSRDTINRTLASLLVVVPENRGSVQVICSDDGSTDGSADEIAAFVNLHPEFCWTIIESPNGGASTARNRGLREAQGKWLLFLDADDELALDPCRFLSECDASATILCFPIERRFWPSGTSKVVPAPRIRALKVRDTLSSVVPLHICAGIFVRKLAPHPFEQDLQYLEDWLFWWSNANVFRHVSRVIDAGPLCIVNIHQSNRTSKYAATGVARELLSEKIMRESTLTRIQLNNFRIQRNIGRLLQGRSIPLSAFLFLPCSLVLWCKLLVYWLYGSRIDRIHPYGRNSEENGS